MSRTTIKKAARYAAADEYFDLVRRFPLRPIRSDEDYDRAIEILTELVKRADNPGLTAGEQDYFDVLKSGQNSNMLAGSRN